MSIKEVFKSRLNNIPLLLFIFRKVFHFFVFLLSILARTLNAIKITSGYVTAQIIFATKPGNIFFKDFFTDILLTRKLKYNHEYFNVKINTYWDYWRLFDYEKYPIEVLSEDILKKDLKQSIVYYEIGANIGYSALIIAKKLEKIGGHVYAFEVEPTNFKTLCDNIILNKLVNITPINVGISSNSRISKFYYNIYHTKMRKNLPMSGMGAHSINYDSKLHDKGVYCNVLLMPFDKIVEEFSLKKASHIFIDTHGAELEVIKSMTNTIKSNEIEKIMVDIEEIGIKNVEDSEVYSKLIKHGFKIEKYETVIGQDVFQNSYRSVFSKTKQS